MSIDNGPSARAGPSSKQRSSSNKKAEKAKVKDFTAKLSPTALQTPPPTPKDDNESDSTKQGEDEGGEQRQHPDARLGSVKQEGEEEDVYYKLFLARLYHFGKAAESGVGVEKSWEQVVGMDPVRISSSLLATKANQEAGNKLAEAHEQLKVSLDAIGGREGAEPDPHTPAATPFEDEIALPESLRIVIADMLGPDWSKQLRGFGNTLQDLHDRYGRRDDENVAASNGCIDPDCECSIPLVSTFEIDDPERGAWRQGTESISGSGKDAKDKGSQPWPMSDRTASTQASRPISPLPRAPKRPDTPRPPMTPLTAPTNTSSEASPLDAALAELRGKTISTPRLRQLWHLAVRNMPRQSETYTFRPPQILDPMMARLLCHLASKNHYSKHRAVEMGRILASPLGEHLSHIVGGNDDDATRHLSRDLARCPMVYGAAHIAHFGRMALLSLESDIDPSSGRKRVEFTPIPFNFGADELKAPQKGRKSFGAFEERMGKIMPLCQKMCSHVGVVQVDEDVPMAWSVHFVTRKAVIYPAVPGDPEAALECLKRLVKLFECCDDCKKRPWGVEVGRMWTTNNQPSASALTAHIVQELIINPSACIEGLDPRRYSQEGQPSPGETLLSEGQMWWLTWQQSQLVIDNFYALKKLSDDLGIVSA